jgi:hypothetical protein
MFPVKEVPAIGVDSDREIDSTGYKFIVREDTGQVLSCMTDSYRLVTNKSIIEAAAPIVKKHDGEVKEVSIFSNGRSVHMKWNFPKHMKDW